MKPTKQVIIAISSALLLLLLVATTIKLRQTASLAPQEAYAATSINCNPGINIVVPTPVPGCTQGQGDFFADIWYTNDNSTTTEIKRGTVTITSPSANLTISNYWGWSGGTEASQQQPNEEYDAYVYDGSGKKYGPYHCKDFGDYPTYNNPTTGGGVWQKCSEISIPWQTTWTKADVELVWNSANKSTPGSHLGSVVLSWCGKTPATPTPKYATTPTPTRTPTPKPTVTPTPKPGSATPTPTQITGNLLPNPGFETGSGSSTISGYFTSPTSSSGLTYTWASDFKRTQSRSAKISYTGTNTTLLSRWLTVNNSIATTVGKVYTGEVYVRTSAAISGQVQLTVNYLDKNTNSFLGGKTSSSISNTNGAWQKISVTPSTGAPANSYVRLELRLTGPGTVWFDDAVLK